MGGNEWGVNEWRETNEEANSGGELGFLEEVALLMAYSPLPVCAVVPQSSGLRCVVLHNPEDYDTVADTVALHNLEGCDTVADTVALHNLEGCDTVADTVALHNPEGCDTIALSGAPKRP